MENSKPEGVVNELEAQGFAIENVECMEQHRERRALRRAPPPTEAEIEEYRIMLPTLRWLHAHYAVIEQALGHHLPTIIAKCPMASRLLGGD